MTEQQHEQQAEEGPAALRDHAKALEAQLREATEKVDALTRTNAFLGAGVNPDSTDANPGLRYFVKGYDGDVSPEAIREAAIAAGFIQPGGAPPEQRQAIDRMESAIGEAPPAMSAEANEIAKIAAAKTPDELRQVIEAINVQRAASG